MVDAVGFKRAIGHEARTVAYNATAVKPPVAYSANDVRSQAAVSLRMPQRKKLTRTDQIHAAKTPIRRHFLAERAMARGLNQVDIARELEVDKSTVSRWFNGTIPDNKNLDRLVALLHLEDTADLFRSPDDDWMSRFLRGRNEDEIDRIKKTLETAFPPKPTGTDG